MSVGYVVCVPVHETYTVLPVKIKEGDRVVTAFYSTDTVYSFTCRALIVCLNKGGKGQ